MDIAIVTGVSHPKGIGASICRRLSKNGVDIFFTHWQADKYWPNLFADEIRDKGVRCKSLEINLGDKQAADTLINQVVLHLGSPTILVNNAAYSSLDGYQKLNADILDRHYEVNVRAVCLLSVEFAKQLEGSTIRRGRIINLTSGQAQGPMLNELAYAASKGAITAFTLTLSAELAHLGITVNAVNPGPTDTGWMTDEIKGELTTKFPMGRVGQPEDAARLVAFLASEEAGWITGQVINSEGGFLRK
ncbi:SDR family oxidoreductase [Shimazuella sp. AN120528]|uniref:SDR family oxidoreductase n=1 Tax=Shimazuella soli TaxID=1892854 RepID=UPI001F0D58F0|nr:SDR family oxidoreductase [Shimazuella soli]MCH5585482.1 SDR family oxidoreductase [Shimazuella soli]